MKSERLHRMVSRIALAVLIGLTLATAAAAQRLAQGSQCRYSNQCMDPLFCQGGACVVQCLDHRDCLYGYFCTRPVPEAGASILPPEQFVRDNYRCLPPGVRYTAHLQNGEWTTVLEEFDAYQRRTGVGYAQPNPGANLGSAQTGSALAMIGGVVGVAQPAGVVGSGDSYFRGGDGALWVRSANGQEQPTTAGAISTSDLVWVARPSGEVAVIHRADTDEIWMTDCRASQCGPWIDLGGQLETAPTAWLGADGGIVVRGTGLDSRTWQTILYGGETKVFWEPVDK